MPFNQETLTSAPKHAIGLADIFFVLFVLILCYLAYQGSLAISANGARIDSDLATYVQAAAAAANPELFLGDPVLQTRSPANSIVTAERILARFLTPQDQYAIGFLRAGSVIFFVYCISWYIFGRWLFIRRVYAFLLFSFVSITVWIGFGTFWGVAHSDPVPRVFHAALWSWMLMLAIVAYKRISLRPFALFCAGLSLWFHGVSGLVTGAMFFCAFFFAKPAQCSLARHIKILVIALFAFFVPVLFFLWSSLKQTVVFSPEQLLVFAQAFSVRWREDYGDIGGSLLSLIAPWNPSAYIFYAGLLATVYCRLFANERVRNLARMIPSFLFAYACVAVFSILETHYAVRFGRVPMGHELVRGVKFFVPLSWIMITAAIIGVTRSFPKFVTKFLTCLFFAATIFFSHDKQYVAAEYALSQMTGCNLPLTAEGDIYRKKAERVREALHVIQSEMTLGDSAFCLEDSLMSLRYAIFCPLVYSFKDGYIYFYNKDYEGVRNWLSYTESIEQGEEGIFDVLTITKAKWYLAPKSKQLSFEKTLNLVWENSDWRLYKMR